MKYCCPHRPSRAEKLRVFVGAAHPWTTASCHLHNGAASFPRALKLTLLIGDSFWLISSRFGCDFLLRRAHHRHGLQLVRQSVGCSLQPRCRVLLVIHSPVACSVMVWKDTNSAAGQRAFEGLSAGIESLRGSSRKRFTASVTVLKPVQVILLSLLRLDEPGGVQGVQMRWIGPAAGCRWPKWRPVAHQLQRPGQPVVSRAQVCHDLMVVWCRQLVANAPAAKWCCAQRQSAHCRQPDKLLDALQASTARD